MSAQDGGPAFPTEDANRDPARGTYGMSLRQWYAGQALTNPALCTGSAPEYQLKAWFGDRGGIMQQEIAARQAWAYADAMLKARGETK